MTTKSNKFAATIKTIITSVRGARVVRSLPVHLSSLQVVAAAPLAVVVIVAAVVTVDSMVGCSLIFAQLFQFSFCL